MSDEPNIFSYAPIEIALDHRLTLRHVRVLIALYSFRSKSTNTVWPKRETLAARCGFPLTRISTITTELARLGWLEKVGAGGRSSPSHYRLTVPDLVTVTNSETVTDPVTETVTNPVTKTVTKPVTRKEVSKEVSSEESIPSATRVAVRATATRFDEFWAALPTGHRKDKKAALRVWKRDNLDEKADMIIADIRRRPLEDDQWKRGYGPQPPAYLNGERWEDEYATPGANHAAHSQPRNESRAERGARMQREAEERAKQSWAASGGMG